MQSKFCSRMGLPGCLRTAFHTRQTLRNDQLRILIEKEDVLVTSFSSFPAGTGN